MPKKKPPPEQGNLIASIETVEQSYFISQHRLPDRCVDDEAILSITGKVEEISPRHKRMLGEKIEMTFLCARRFVEDAAPNGKPMLFDLNMRKDRCGFMVYLPADAFWALPAMISSKAVTHIEAMFEEPHRGSAELIGVHFAPASKPTTLLRDLDL